MAGTSRTQWGQRPPVHFRLAEPVEYRTPLDEAIAKGELRRPTRIGNLHREWPAMEEQLAKRTPADSSGQPIPDKGALVSLFDDVSLSLAGEPLPLFGPRVHEFSYAFREKPSTHVEPAPWPVVHPAPHPPPQEPFPIIEYGPPPPARPAPPPPALDPALLAYMLQAQMGHKASPWGPPPSARPDMPDAAHRLLPPRAPTPTPPADPFDLFASPGAFMRSVGTPRLASTPRSRPAVEPLDACYAATWPTPELERDDDGATTPSSARTPSESDFDSFASPSVPSFASPQSRDYWSLDRSCTPTWPAPIHRSLGYGADSYATDLAWSSHGGY